MKMNLPAAAVVIAGLLSASAASATPLVVNGSFEAPALGSTPYMYPFGLASSWTYGGSALVNTSVGANAWYGGSAPAGYDGLQFAALQGTSSLSQIFNAATAGSATVSWLAAGRPDFGGPGAGIAGDQTYDVFLNGNLLGAYATSSGQAFTLASTIGNILAGLNTLSFVGTDLSRTGDQTSFIDLVSVESIASTDVPEPITLAIFGAALAGMAMTTRRRKARKA